MSGLGELREAYGLYDCEDYELIDSIVDEISKQEQSEEERFELKKGRLAHRITLTKCIPASVVKAELNIELDRDVNLSGFNALCETDCRSPGAWFVNHGFIVRSKIESGYWIQYAFKSEGSDNLTRSEIMDYLNFSTLSYDENTIDYFGPIIIER